MKFKFFWIVRELLYKPLFGKNCFIGTGVVINSGTILGKQCIVGANSVLSGSYPDYCVIVGAPGRIIKKYNNNKKKWKKLISMVNL